MLTILDQEDSGLNVNQSYISVTMEVCLESIFEEVYCACLGSGLLGFFFSIKVGFCLTCTVWQNIRSAYDGAWEAKKISYKT